MTATLTFGPPATAPGRATFTALAIRETRRFILNPVFLSPWRSSCSRYGRARKPGKPRSTPPTRTRRSSSAGSA